MPDKFDKYPIDNALIDDGWSKMQALLDSQMPKEEKRRRIIPIWWKSGIAASVFIVSFFVFRESGKEKIDVAHQNPLIIENQVSNNSLTENANTIITKPTQTQLNLPIDKKISTRIKTSQSNNKITNPTLQKSVKTELPQMVNPLEIGDKNISQSTDNQLIESKNTTISLLNNSDLKRQEIGLLSFLTLTKNANINVPTTNMKIAKTAVKIKKQHSFKHGIFARFNYTGLIDNGYTYGYILRKNLQGRHNVQGRIYFEKNTRFVNTVSETFTIPKHVIDKNVSTSNSPSFNADTTITRTVYPYSENSNLKLIAQQNNINTTLIEHTNEYILLNSKHLGISMNYGYRISPRWEIATGLGLSKTISNIQYGFEITESRYSFNSKDAFNGVQSANSNQFTTLNTQTNIFNKYDGYIELGANLFVTKRFALGAIYRYGIIDITKNDAIGKKDYNNFAVMQGIFYFN